MNVPFLFRFVHVFAVRRKGRRGQLFLNPEDGPFLAFRKKDYPDKIRRYDFYDKRMNAYHFKINVSPTMNEVFERVE